MPVYARKLNGRQRAALRAFEAVSGLEPLHQEDLDAGTMTFEEVWRSNQTHMFDIYSEVQNIDTRGCFGPRSDEGADAP